MSFDNKISEAAHDPRRPAPLFLDVMQTLGSYEYDFKRRRWHDPKRHAAVNPRGFSYDRIIAVLNQRCGFKEYGKWDRINPFLVLGPGQDLETQLRRENALKGWEALREELGAKIAYRNLLQLIASGELTKADFKR